MNYIISILFVIAGLINFAPISGVLSGEQLDKLYQIGAIHPDIELLMRHRAILFGMVGSVICIAAFVPSLRMLATFAGLASMLSFVVLVFATQSSNSNLIQIAWIDIAATVVLLFGFGLHMMATAQTSPQR